MAEPVIPLPNNANVPENTAKVSVQPTPQQALKAFIKANLREGIDYGQIPGLGNKNQLFKPGAAKIINFLRLRPEVQLLHAGMGAQNLVVSQSVKRATISAVKNLIV